MSHSAGVAVFFAITGLLPAILSGCGEAAVPVAVDAGPADVAVLPQFGALCDPAIGCSKGFFCLDSDYAKPFCVATCEPGQVKDYCKQPELNGAAAFCVQMPKDFAGPSTPLCLPICANVAQCHQTNPSWELCAKPTYKNIVLITDLPTKVCQSPSAHGQIHVDPVLCDWQDKAGALPQFAEAKQACVAVCKGLLKSCQLWPKPKTEDCCGWACFQWVTPGGKLDNTRLSGKIKCLITAFNSFQNTPQVCTGWQDQCGDLPAWVKAQ